MPRFFWALHRSAPLPPQVGTQWCACAETWVGLWSLRANARTQLHLCSLARCCCAPLCSRSLSVRKRVQRCSIAPCTSGPQHALHGHSIGLIVASGAHITRLNMPPPRTHSLTHRLGQVAIPDLSDSSDESEGGGEADAATVFKRTDAWDAWETSSDTTRTPTASESLARAHIRSDDCIRPVIDLP